jgi:drug/metabolite transporter (DMT)-like permease
VLLYRALACGVMSLVAPTSAAAAAAVPVTAGIAAGERLGGPAIVGVTAALVSVVLLTRTSTAPRQGAERVVRGMAYAVLAGVSFGVFLVLLAQTSGASGLWPLVGARCASLTLLVGLALARRHSLALTGPTARLALLAGILDMASNVLFLIAVRGGDLALVGLAASMSPLGTVALAQLVLHERIRAIQGFGAALAIGSVMLLAMA